MADVSWRAGRIMAAVAAVVLGIVLVAGCGDDACDAGAASTSSSVPLAFELPTTPMSAADAESLPVPSAAARRGPRIR